MDETTRPGGEAVDPVSTPGNDQPKDPQELRREIEQTREALGDTVEALAEKTDVKAQAKQRVDALKATAQQKASDLKEAAPESATQGAQQVAAAAQQQPVPFAAGGAFVAGLLLGWLIGRRGD